MTNNNHNKILKIMNHQKKYQSKKIDRKKMKMIIKMKLKINNKKNLIMIYNRIYKMKIQKK